jgi:protein-tyrosine phosphatase
MGEWLSTGSLVQITAASLHGRFGQVAQKTCHWLLERNWVHFIATDAHNLTSRPPQMRAAYDSVAEKYGEATAQRLCMSNPLAVFEGQPLQAQPDLLDIGRDVDTMHASASRKSGRHGFLGRFFSRD